MVSHLIDLAVCCHVTKYFTFISASWNKIRLHVVSKSCIIPFLFDPKFEVCRVRGRAAIPLIIIRHGVLLEHAASSIARRRSLSDCEIYVEFVKFKVCKPISRRASNQNVLFKASFSISFIIQ